MSKRFGRRRKAKLRQEICDLQTQNHKLQIANNRFDRRVKELEEVVDDVNSIVGHNFIGFEPDVAESHHPEVESFQVQQHHTSHFDCPQVATFKKVSLPLLRVATENELEPLRGPKVKVFYNGKQYAYACSPSLLQNLPKPIAIKHISREIATLLVDSL